MNTNEVRLIDKLKKKLRVMEKLNYHKGNIVGYSMAGLGAVHLIGSPFNPYIGVVAMSTSLVIGLTAGLDVVNNEDMHNMAINELKGHIDALQNPNMSTIAEIEAQIQDTKNKPVVTKRDKQLQKRLIRHLIERKKLVITALKEEGTDVDSLSI